MANSKSARFSVRPTSVDLQLHILVQSVKKPWIFGPFCPLLRLEFQISDATHSSHVIA
jgi:hypothetical protein